MTPPPQKDKPAHAGMTSMIDIVFLLLVFFVLVTKLNDNDIGYLSLPEADQASPDVYASMRTVVNIDADGTIVLHGRECGINDLRALLSIDRDLSPHRLVHIRADKATPCHNVRQVMAACREFGVSRMTIAAAIPED